MAKHHSSLIIDPGSATKPENLHVISKKLWVSSSNTSPIKKKKKPRKLDTSSPTFYQFIFVSNLFLGHHGLLFLCLPSMMGTDILRIVTYFFIMRSRWQIVMDAYAFWSQHLMLTPITKCFHTNVPNLKIWKDMSLKLPLWINLISYRCSGKGIGILT